MCQCHLFRFLWVGKIPWRRKWQPTPVFLPGESHGWKSLVGYSPRGCEESYMTERLHSLRSTKLLNFDQVQFFFLLLLILSVSYLRNYWWIQGHEDLHLFYVKSFIVLVLTFRISILILFWINFCMLCEALFYFLHVAIQFLSIIYWKDYSFPPNYLIPLVKINWP